jgi:acyl-CoA hydrolase
MGRSCTALSVEAAVARLRPGMKVLVPPGCGEPSALIAGICADADRLRDLTLMGGIHLGGFPWATPERGALRTATWHMAPRLEDARRRGRVEFAPVRYFELVREFAAGGTFAPDCVIVHTAPPDARGYLSLGVAVGVALPAARTAPLVIAQVNPRMPRTRGNCWLHSSQIDIRVDVDEPLVEYPPPVVGEVERAIGRHVAGLVPDGGTVQVGVGAIPQAVLEALDGHRDLALHSLLVDASVTLVERGVVTAARKPFHRGRLDVAEAMGTRRLFDFLHDNPLVNMESSAFVHDPDVVARLDRFVAINSALEIDLTGQVNAEALGDRQIAGIGGQFDFVLGASRARGGASVIALPSTGGRDGVSRIVPRLAPGAPVTTPRYLADWVVTEHGATRLRGLGERQRAAALIAVAHPRYREELARAAATS